MSERYPTLLIHINPSTNPRRIVNMHSCGSAFFLLLHLLRVTHAEGPYTTLECGLHQGTRPLASTARVKRVAGGVLVFARNSNRHCHLPPKYCSAEVRVHPLGIPLMGCSTGTQKQGVTFWSRIERVFSYRISLNPS